MATPNGTPVSAGGLQRSAERHWRASDGSCCLSISNSTLEQIRFEISCATNGPGGQGVGGVLLGTRLGDYFRIVSYLPIPCEHALGPDFRLSSHEQSGLPVLLDELKSGSGMQASRPVGWFVSHPRGSLQLTGEENRFHQKFFDGGQLAMVAKPDRLGEMDLAVHYSPEEPDSGPHFVEPVLAIVPDASYRPARRLATDRHRAAEVRASIPGFPATAKSPVRPDLAPPALPAPPATPGRRSLWLPALVALLLASVCGAFYLNGQRADHVALGPATAQAPMEMLSLNAYEARGRFYISWNGNADAIQRAERIVLLIQDGGKATRYQLSNKEAATGVRVYRRSGGGVKVTLEVHGRMGGVTEESTHYGPPESTRRVKLRVIPGAGPGY